MCKILVIPHVPDGAGEAAWMLAQAALVEMSVVNSHGVGYAAVDDTGQVYGERWLRNEDAFVTRFDAADKQKVADFKGFLRHEEVYSSFGHLVPEKQTKSIILHARYATSGKQFENTHPFVDDDMGAIALIHNGVISNVETKDQIVSSCDSERILRKYLEFDVANEPANINKVAEQLRGYYGVALYATTSEGQVVLDLFRCHLAKLSAVDVEGIGLVIATDPNDVITAAGRMKMRVKNTYVVAYEQMLRFDPLGNKVLSVHPFSAVAGYGFGDKKSHNRYQNESGWPDITTKPGKWEPDDWEYSESNKTWSRVSNAGTGSVR